MMIKITEKCSMGCSHCMNNATADGREMTLDTFKDVLSFLNKQTSIGGQLIITGGEPTEHSQFIDIMKCAIDWIQKESRVRIVCLTVTTNGFWVVNNSSEYLSLCEYADKANVILMFQVTADTTYYPKKLPTHKKILRDKHVCLCDKVELIYPQGRAVTNNIPWSSKASKCFNVRAISKQLNNVTLGDIMAELARHGKFCTPHVKYDGTLGLGESDLCPSVASIYDSEEDIVKKIQEFKCHGCDVVNDSLDEKYKKFL